MDRPIMTVKRLIALLSRCHPDAKVWASDIYGEGEFPVKGAVYDDQYVTLSGENND